MPNADKIKIEIKGDGLSLMDRPVRAPTSLRVISGLLGDTPENISPEPMPWERQAAHRIQMYRESGMIVQEDVARNLAYDIEIYFRPHSPTRAPGKIPIEITIMGVLVRPSLSEIEACTMMPFMQRRIAGRLRGEFGTQSVIMVFSKDRESRAAAPRHRQEALHRTLASLSISLSTDWRWGTGKLPPEGEIGPPLPLGGW